MKRSYNASSQQNYDKEIADQQAARKQPKIVKNEPNFQTSVIYTSPSEQSLTVQKTHVTPEELVVLTIDLTDPDESELCIETSKVTVALPALAGDQQFAKHQVYGIKHLILLDSARGGGMLCDDPGLGKTCMSLHVMKLILE